MIANLGIGGKVAEVASQLSHEKYVDVLLEPFRRQLAILMYREDKTRIRLGDLGDGIKSYVITRILYEYTKPDIILWDDVESHMNPRVLSHIAGWIHDMLDEGRQVVVATHSLEAAEILAGVNEERATLYLTDLRSGILRSKRLRLKDVEELREAGVDIRVAEEILI